MNILFDNEKEAMIFAQAAEGLEGKCPEELGYVPRECIGVCSECRRNAILDISKLRHLTEEENKVYVKGLGNISRVTGIDLFD